LNLPIRDDPHCDWSTFELVIIRSTWDYCSRLDEFLSWSDKVSRSTLLRNPAEIVQWNSDKRYLAALDSQGVPVLQTSFAEPGESVPLPTQHDFVIKPVVSAGARDTARYTQDQIGAALQHAEQLHATGMPVMVQPFLTQISKGERSLVFLDGQFSHAIRKGPVLTKPGFIDNARVAHPSPTRHDPSDQELDLAAKAIAATPASPGSLLYTRVDMAMGPAGDPLIMELELIEPNLFLGWSEGKGALLRFTDAVEAQLRRFR
jgi:glutathione synthase/RimK-type ligase-like ATP-grasp enzyme